MEFGEAGYTKHDYANTLAATLGHFLFHQGDAIGLLSFAEGIGDYVPARNRSGHLRRILLHLERSPHGRATDLGAPLQRILELVRKRGLVVLISDFLAPLERMEEKLVSIRACGHEMQVFHLLDPAERHFTFQKASLFRDFESGRELYIDPRSRPQGVPGAAGAPSLDHPGAFATPTGSATAS